MQTFEIDDTQCAGLQWASKKWREMQSASGAAAKQ